MQESEMNSPQEILLQTETVMVRKMTLAPNEIGPMHFHTRMAEHIVCLTGEILVSIQDAAPHRLLPGQSVVIQPTVCHRVKNERDSVSEYLLTQSGGDYDRHDV